VHSRAIFVTTASDIRVTPRCNLVGKTIRVTSVLVCFTPVLGILTSFFVLMALIECRLSAVIRFWHKKYSETSTNRDQILT
jgi:hypothetical protein